MRIPATLLILLIVFTFTGCGDDSDQPAVGEEITFTAEGILDFVRPDSSIITRIAIELAETDAEQAQGLMYRRSLPARGGMLFVDPEPQMQSFWMRNTPLPLDIIFLDENGRIVNIVKRTTPYSDDRIESTAPAQYVLEVRAGFTDRYGIDESVRVDWERRDMNSQESSE